METKGSTSLLKSYEIYSSSGTSFIENLFRVIFVFVLALFVGIGLYFQTVESPSMEISEQISRIKTRFLIKEKVTKVIKIKKPEKKKEKKKPVIKKPEKKPVDLTKKPELRKKVDDIRKKTKKKKVRRVYGLKRVYSKGIGTGGSLSDAVIGKIGNTLNKEVDTLTATKEDLKGEVVSVTTITTSPKYKKRPRPEYTEEMKEKLIEGVVKVKVLVDIDGKVKKAIALNDLGYGSARAAASACLEALFEPAKRDGVPVAVWIIIPVRFKMLG